MSRNLVIAWQARSVVKDGNRPEENEDRIRPHMDRRRFVRRRELRCAVSDGATQSAFSAMWASQLLDEIQAFPLSQDNLQTGVHRAQKRWWEDVNQRQLAWNVEWKVREGAHATLACLNVREGGASEGGGAWTAIVVGDSCIFQVRDGEVLIALPMERSSEFDNHPQLVSSLEERNERLWPNLRLVQHEWRSGDEFLLMTDALAQWFLAELEAGRRPVEELGAVIRVAHNRQDAFAHWVAQARAEKKMRNDDTTLGWARATRI